MNFRIFSISVAFLIAPGGASSVLAWGQNGHRVTAEIAERNLNPKALAVVRSILGEESLAEIATWPDDIRSDGTWDFVQPWHFISIDDDESWEGLKRFEGGDVLAALDLLEKFLRDPKTETLTLSGKVKGKGLKSGLLITQKKEIGKREALAFFVHFAGDVHQPLHVGRRNDFGGNRIEVSWFKEDQNLHKIWDELLIESLQLSFTELSTFLNRVPEEQRKAWSKSSFLDWAKESKEIRPKVYDFGAQPKSDTPKPKPVLSWSYRYETLPIIRERLAKGGIRVASKLNEFFAGYPE